MQMNQIMKQQKELSPEEGDLVQRLEFYTPPLTLKSLARSLSSTEEKVRENLSNLGLLDLVSKARIAERRKIHVLALQGYRDFLRAVREGPGSSS